MPGSAIVFVLAGFLLISVMDAIIKSLSGIYGALELMLFQTTIGVVPVSAMVLATGGLQGFRSTQPALQALRAIAATATTIFFFIALRHLPLAEAVTLVFAAPMIMTALAGPILGESVGPERWFAVLVGFVGVLVVMRPGTAAFSIYALLPITAAVCFAFASVLGRRLSRNDGGPTIVFYSLLGGALVSAAWTPFEWVMPRQEHWPSLLAIGLLGGIGQVLIMAAFRRAQASLLAPFQYATIGWAVLFGYIFWSEVPDAITFVGIAIIALSGLYIVKREARSSRHLSSASQL